MDCRSFLYFFTALYPIVNEFYNEPFCEVGELIGRFQVCRQVVADRTVRHDVFNHYAIRIAEHSNHLTVSYEPIRLSDALAYAK